MRESDTRRGGPGRARSARANPEAGAYSPRNPDALTRSPRHVAYETMRAVDGGAYANLDLPVRLREAGLSPRDAAFATELVYGATRMRGLYDAVIARCAGREVSAIDAALLDVLRLGVHQLLGMRVAAHAAVDQSVSLARDLRGRGAGGFVNAVLRRVGEEDRTTWLALVAPDEGGDAALAVEYSHPQWVVTALREALLGHGTSTAESVGADLTSLLAADNAPPRVSLVVRPGLTTVADLVREGAEASGLSPVGAVLRTGGDPSRIRAIREARAGVQDEGSQLVALALAGAPTGPGPERGAWLDLCAGPGGKTALLTGLAAAGGVTLYANDVSDQRSALVRTAVRALVRAGAAVMIGTGDGRTVGAEEPGAYDRVLVDAPCTGLGALRRRPEARWRRRPEDVSALTSLQGDLLVSGLQAVRPGGVVGYVTCSPHLAETRQLVGDVLHRHPEVEVLDAQPLVVDAAGQQIAHLGDPPFVQLWPHLHGTDAMFLALLRVPGR